MTDVASPKSKKNTNPMIVMFSIVILATLLTFLLPSGQYQMKDKLIVPGSYTQIDKPIQASNIISSTFTTASKEQASPVGIAEMLEAIPAGIAKQSGLIFMVLFIGGMFGVLNKSGAIEAGLERALGLTRGNIYILIPVLTLIFSAGSTFMGLAKEYLLVIPMVIALTTRLGFSRILGLAIVTLAVKVGYLASITNPYALSVAQPLLGLPVFSGINMRILTYVVMMTLCIIFLFWRVRQEIAGGVSTKTITFDSKPLSTQHFLMILVLIIGIIFLVYAAHTWKWKSSSLSAYYMFLSIIFAAIARFSPSEAADAFISGMKKVLIAAILIGLATAVAIVLEKGKIMDTIIYYFVSFVGESNPYISTYSMFISQLLLDLAVPSTSGQAAVTMPIMGPVGQLSGVSAQTTVLAFLMGNGLTNVITPTSTGLLIFLATAEIGWGQWARYVWPLVIFLALAAIALLSIAVSIGY